MSCRHPSRFALHLLLALALVLPRIAAPVQAITHMPVAANATSARHGATEDNVRCGGMPSTVHHHATPAGCGTHDCDLSTCIGMACLAELPRMPAHVAASTQPLSWRQPIAPRHLIDPLLRPPIA